MNRPFRKGLCGGDMAMMVFQTWPTRPNPFQHQPFMLWKHPAKPAQDKRKEAAKEAAK
jgi:hypothetical protein